MTDDQRRMLKQAQNAAIELGNENFRLRAENARLQAENAEMRTALKAARPCVDRHVFCPVCGACFGGHAHTCPFVKFAPKTEEADDACRS